MKTLIQEVRELINIDNDTLSWGDVCKHTYFDSFVTALAYGMKWGETDIYKIPEGHLKMVIFNVINYPKECGHCSLLENINYEKAEGLCVGCEPNSLVNTDFSCSNFRNPRITNDKEIQVGEK